MAQFVKNTFSPNNPPTIKHLDSVKLRVKVDDIWRARKRWPICIGRSWCKIMISRRPIIFMKKWEQNSSWTLRFVLTVLPPLHCPFPAWYWQAHSISHCFSAAKSNLAQKHLLTAHTAASADTTDPLQNKPQRSAAVLFSFFHKNDGRPGDTDLLLGLVAGTRQLLSLFQLRHRTGRTAKVLPLDVDSVAYHPLFLAPSSTPAVKVSLLIAYTKNCFGVLRNSWK